MTCILASGCSHIEDYKNGGVVKVFYMKLEDITINEDKGIIIHDGAEMYDKDGKLYYVFDKEKSAE